MDSNGNDNAPKMGGDIQPGGVFRVALITMSFQLALRLTILGVKNILWALRWLPRLLFPTSGETSPREPVGRQEHIYDVS